MTHRDRIEAALKGEPTDRVPVALWRHFPYVDQTAEGLAGAVIDFQKQFEFDIVKVTPTSGYPAEAWGATLQHRDNDEGTREYTKRAVQSPADWTKLAPLDFTDGVLARELSALRQVREGVGPDVHVLQTIFSPLTIGKQLGGDLLQTSMSDHADELKVALETVAETMARYAAASLENGADGIFFASQLAGGESMPDEQYAEFGVPYDLKVLEGITGKDALVLLHLHGGEPMFGLANKYGVQIVNWHDRETQPTLKEGKQMFSGGAVLGGLDRSGLLLNGTPEQVEIQVKDAIRQTDGLGVIIGAGCVTMATTPEANIAAARRAVEPT